MALNYKGRQIPQALGVRPYAALSPPVQALISLSTYRLFEGLADLMTLAEIINSSPTITINHDANLGQAAEALSRENIGVLIVTDGGGMVGVISERDLVRVLSDAKDGVRSLLVAAYMSNRVVACEQSEPPDTAIWLMAEYGIRHLPVTSAGKHVGMVSSSDILRLISEQALEQAI